MLNVLQFRDHGHGASKYAEYAKSVEGDMLQHVGARRVLYGYARTVIGKKEFHAVAIVEYPSPEAFVSMMTSSKMAEKNRIRLQGLAEQYLIPLRPGWFHIERAAPTPKEPFTHFTEANVWGIPNGMVGSTSEGAREGVTSATREQIQAFVQDEKIGDTKKVWHLNLLQFAQGNGEGTYAKYAKAMGGRDGVLSSFGARSTLATDCFKSIMGDADFQRAIIVEYPCRDSFISMGCHEKYLQGASLRHKGLSETYIISCLPEILDTS